MNQTEAAKFVAEDLGQLQDGQSKVIRGELFRAAFESPASPEAARLGFLHPTITAETAFSMSYPQWTCVFSRSLDTYTVTKPRRNPYA